MMSTVTAILFLSMAFSASAAGFVDQQLKDSVVDFHKISQQNVSTVTFTNSTSSDLSSSFARRKSEVMPLLEEALELIYDELYDRPSERYPSPRFLSPRQSFFSNGLASLSEYLMSLVENSLEDLPSLPRLEAQECMKRSVCEAHNQPKKYGLMGLVLQLLFPPYTKTEDPNNVASKYQLAARYGRQNNANCGIQYDGCMINILDIIQAIVNTFIR